MIYSGIQQKKKHPEINNALTRNFRGGPHVRLFAICVLTGGSLSETLRAVDVPILSDEKCKEVYKENYEPTMLCAGYDEGGQDSCQGDSGGPFVQRSSDGVSTLIGIVSWGYGCAQPNYPGVYTETAHYIDWITRTMKTLGSGSLSP
ncbi:UNVERIFIED_CONTAM: Trypsin-1 [Trichonephila clavipes]